MNFIRNMLRKGAIKSYRKEMEQFVSNLQVMGSDEIAVLMEYSQGGTASSGYQGGLLEVV